MLSMALTGRKKRGRPQRRFMNVVKEDMQTAGVAEQDARYRVRWRLWQALKGAAKQRIGSRIRVRLSLQ